MLKVSVSTNSELEQLYRKRLLVLATGILIFVIAGGSLSVADVTSNTTEIVVFGVKLLFSRPSWLEWSALAVMGYFWLRHQQFSADERETLKQEIYDGIKIRRSVVERNLNRNFTTYHGPQDYPGRFKTVKFYHGIVGDLIDEYEPYHYEISVNVLSPTKIIICITLFDRDSTTRELSGWQIGSLSGIMEIIYFYIDYLFSYIRCAYRVPAFCHAKLPSWLAITSFTLYVVNAFA
ncbi:hypothetical protein ACET93_15335 [Aeromonas veronii]